jgi:hypothetical protein
MHPARLILALLILPLAGLAVVLMTRPALATEHDTALLTAAELPPGWEMISGEAPAPSSYAWCPGGAALPVVPRERAAGSFAGGTPGPLLYHEVLRFARGDAHRALAAVRASPGPCSWEVAEPGLGAMTFNLTAMTERALGEEAIRRELMADWDGLVVQADVVIIRAGDLVALLTVVTIDPDSAPPDAALSDQLATLAAAKLLAVADAGP